MNKPVLPMSSLSLRLPTSDRKIETYRLAASRTFPARLEGTLNRVAFSAAHVVADPLADNDPWLSAAIDWDRTIAFREHVWDLGLGVAEAMDTAQRGMGLDWKTSLELIQRSVRAARARGALVFSGAGTDHLSPADTRTLDDVIHAYEEQFGFIEGLAEGEDCRSAVVAHTCSGRSPWDAGAAIRPGDQKRQASRGRKAASRRRVMQVSWRGSPREWMLRRTKNGGSGPPSAAETGPESRGSALPGSAALTRYGNNCI